MVIGAGIGVTPLASIQKGVLRYKWKKGFLPKRLLCYWVVRHSEIESFNWYIDLLVELSNRVKADRSNKTYDLSETFLQINIYVTSAPKDGAPRQTQMMANGNQIKPSSRIKHGDSKDYLGATINAGIGFDASTLANALINPTVSSKDQVASQTWDDKTKAPNRFQDIWIWNGRPNWTGVFGTIKENRLPSTRKVGCCFCGTPIIGKDLKKACADTSSVAENIRFVLHKENF